MSKWFPDVRTQEGVQDALKAGVIGGCAFAVFTGLGAIVVLATSQLPTTAEAVQGPAAIGALIGIMLEASLGVVAALRFRKRKGLIWGSVVLLLFSMEIFMKLSTGGQGFVWVIIYAAILAGLVNGIRGAWAARNGTFTDAETFD